MPDIGYYGKWWPLVLGPKLEAGLGQTARARVEGDRVFLRGAVKVKAGPALAVGDTVFTIPVARVPPPPAIARLVGSLNIAPGTGIATTTVAVLAQKEITLEGLSYYI